MDVFKLNTKQAANEGVEVAIFHPATRADTGIVFKLAGIDSDVYQKASREAQRRRLQVLARGGQMKLTPEELEAESLALLVSCVLGWDGVESEGAALPCTAENVKKVFEACPWIKDQVDAAIGDRALFLPK